MLGYDFKNLLWLSKSSECILYIALFSTVEPSYTIGYLHKYININKKGKRRFQSGNADFSLF